MSVRRDSARPSKNKFPKMKKRNKTKKTRTVTLRPHHVRQSPYPCRFLFAYMYYRIPFSKGTNSYFFSLIRWNKFASD